MENLFQILSQTLAAKEDVVLVTVVASSGSTPRSEGAQMLITNKGRIAGTIGGGAVEFRSEKIAEKVLASQGTILEKFILAPNDIVDLGMICGGKVEVFFQYLSWENTTITQICSAVLEHLETNQQCWLISETSGYGPNNLGFYSESTGLLGFEETELSKTDFKQGITRKVIGDKNYYIESLVQAGKVYIFGGGHVAQALVPVLKALDFYCVVVEDRSEFLTEELFPLADERQQVDLKNIKTAIHLEEEDYGVVMTRGHQFDFELEQQLLKSQAGYIGVMGSKRKVATHIKKLKEIHFELSEIERINMPIGLQIKAETPAELAISIAGELIMKRASR